MRKFLASVALATSVLGAALVSFVPAANASTYSFDLVGTGVTIAGTLDVVGGYAIDGSGTIVSPETGSAAFTLMTTTSPGAAGFVTINPTNFSYRWTGGQDQISDDVVPVDSANGLEFGVGPYNAAGAIFGNNPGYLLGLNIWLNGGDSYTAYVASSDGSNAFYTVTGTFSETPLPSTWFLLLSGFVGFGFLAYRGTKKGSAAFAAA